MGSSEVPERPPRSRLAAIIAACGIIAAVALWSGRWIADSAARAAWRTILHDPAPASTLGGIGDVDARDWDDLLHAYVDSDGAVDYARWKSSASDVERLREFILRCGRVDRTNIPSRPEEMAYWINLYNALTIWGILERYPTSSIRNHAGWLTFNIWKDLRVVIDGRPFSLDDIEHSVLRPAGDARIHFALVCASRGCPRLRNEAYSADRLDAQLNGNARDFLSREENFHIDRERSTVWLSMIFKWYGEDFGSTPVEQLAAIATHAPEVDRDCLLSPEERKVDYLPYDWALNDRPESAASGH